MLVRRASAPISAVMSEFSVLMDMTKCDNCTRNSFESFAYFPPGLAEIISPKGELKVRGVVKANEHFDEGVRLFLSVPPAGWGDDAGEVEDLFIVSNPFTYNVRSHVHDSVEAARLETAREVPG